MQKCGPCSCCFARAAQVLAESPNVSRNKMLERRGSVCRASQDVAINCHFCPVMRGGYTPAARNATAHPAP